MSVSNNSELRIGCQTYTWEMLGSQWRGTPDDLLQAIAAAGYAGIEITDAMIGHYSGQPDLFAEALERHDLSLVAIAFASATGFTEARGFDADLEAAKHWIDFAARFPGAVVSVGSATVMDGGERESRFEIAAEVYSRIGELGVAADVEIAVHPSSHHNTLLFDRSDYDRLFKLLPPTIGWVPDTGHLLRGHADMLDTMRTYADRIRYIHIKDVDTNGAWAMLGSGICDTISVLQICTAAPEFNGWVVLEEESDEAGKDPAGAVMRNRQTIKQLIA